MRQCQTKTRGEQAGKLQIGSKEEERESRLLGLVHGYLLNLQTVVRTDG